MKIGEIDDAAKLRHMLRREEEAYDAGRRAYMALSLKGNPYRRHTKQWRAWNKGWKSLTTQQQGPSDAG